MTIAEIIACVVVGGVVVMFLISVFKKRSRKGHRAGESHQGYFGEDRASGGDGTPD